MKRKTPTFVESGLQESMKLRGFPRRQFLPHYNLAREVIPTA